MKKQKTLFEKYGELLKLLNIEEMVSTKKTNEIIKESLGSFCRKHKNPAIWCYGEHTRMMMADFIYEMKNVKIIIDIAKRESEDNGFQIIIPDQIKDYEIDGIIISTYVYKEEIKERIRSSYKGIDYLDIYDQLASSGIIYKSSYFTFSHPWNRYQVINELQIRYENSSSAAEKEEYLKRIVKEYITIKDFLSAIKYSRKMEYKKENRNILEKLSALYEAEKESISQICQESVLMLCIDGLRRKDLLAGKLPNLLKWIQEQGFFFTDAYSVSTSTYESLIPAYSCNNDMRTKYYEKNELGKEECPFVKEACDQNRKIYFYTDGAKFIDSDDIIYSGFIQTATEKIWNLAVDVDKNSGELLYLHILYESHYSYLNPYTKTPLVVEGSNIMFDFLESRGGKLQTDYEQQQTDALRYIDDILMPFLKLIPCRIVLYADHGNILMKETDTLQSIERTKYTCHNDLIEIPMVIKCPELIPQKDDRLISLMEINNIVCSLLKRERYRYSEPEYIKVQRSEIYNPDFCYLYKKNDREKELQAFELFIFRDGTQLMVYADGTFELFAESEIRETDVKELFKCIGSDLTVCSRENREE